MEITWFPRATVCRNVSGLERLNSAHHTGGFRISPPSPGWLSEGTSSSAKAPAKAQHPQRSRSPVPPHPPPPLRRSSLPGKERRRRPKASPCSSACLPGCRERRAGSKRGPRGSGALFPSCCAAVFGAAPSSDSRLLRPQNAAGTQPSRAQRGRGHLVVEAGPKPCGGRCCPPSPRRFREGARLARAGNAPSCASCPWRR